MFDGHLKAVDIPDSSIDDAKATLAEDMSDLVGLFKRLTGHLLWGWR